MLWVKKIKEGVLNTLKLHPASISTFYISCIFTLIEIEVNGYVEIFNFLRVLLSLFTAALVLCEANFASMKKIGKISSIKEVKKSFVYAIVLAVGIVISGIQAYFIAYGNSELWAFGFYFTRVVMVYLGICLLGSLFFMYKRSGDTFELYAAKAFLGCLKAGLLFVIICLGVLSIYCVFSILLLKIGYDPFVMYLIIVLVGFPMGLMAFSAPGNSISKFEKLVISYLFPSLLVAAFIIIYIYIVKILVTWTFPSNQVFTIMTCLFSAGIVFWTMAQGVTEGKVNNALRIMPLLFIPFIIIQSMSLYMRVSQHGITTSRYLGIMLIIFEIIYEVYYLICFWAKKSIGGILMPLALVLVIVYFIAPEINVYASITNSQKKVIDEFYKAFDESGDTENLDLREVRSSYRQILSHGGLEGQRYLEDLYETHSMYEVDSLLLLGYDSSSETFVFHCHVSVTDYKDLVDIEGYKYYSSVYNNIDCYNNTETLELFNNQSSDEAFITVNIKDLVDEMVDLKKNGRANSDLAKLLKDPIKTDDGLLYIEDISFYYYDNIGYKNTHVSGFYIYN